MILKSTDGFAYDDPRFEGPGWSLTVTEDGARLAAQGQRYMTFETARRKLRGARLRLKCLSVGDVENVVMGDDFVRATVFDVEVIGLIPTPTNWKAKLSESPT